MKKILVLLLVTIIFSCGDSGKKLTVEATVKGLKKGTVYLKKVIDTTLVTVDSVTVNGDSNFTLQTEIDEPEVFHLYLDKNSKENDRISFFGNKGVTKIYTKLENFNFYAKIEGSKQHELYQEYLEMMNKINNLVNTLLTQALGPESAEVKATYTLCIPCQGEVQRYLCRICLIP